MAQADQAAKQSEKQTGRESVDSFKKSSDLRKQAADLATQIETAKAQVVPMQKDLLVAQGQEAVINDAIAEFQKQGQLLDEHWKAVQTQIAAQQGLAKEITEGGGGAATQPAESFDAAGKSITEKAAALAQLVEENEKAS